MSTGTLGRLVSRLSSLVARVVTGCILSINSNTQIWRTKQGIIEANRAQHVRIDYGCIYLELEPRNRIKVRVLKGIRNVERRSREGLDDGIDC